MTSLLKMPIKNQLIAVMLSSYILHSIRLKKRKYQINHSCIKLIYILQNKAYNKRTKIGTTNKYKY